MRLLLAIVRPIVVGIYYLRMTGFPFKTMAVALFLAGLGGYWLRGML